jgi:hypothetical protein
MELTDNFVEKHLKIQACALLFKAELLKFPIKAKYI